MEIIPVQIPAPNAISYPVMVGNGILRELPQIVHDLGNFDNIAILYDEAVEHIAKKLEVDLDAVCSICVSSGEHTKSLSEVERIVSALLEKCITRESLLMNVGGGVLTDLGGFVASVYMRGITFVNVPTTLLAMVDASVGGKTGVNMKNVKNVIGHYHHPKAVFADIATLATLPDQQLHEGLVEVIKIAAVADRAFFERLKQCMSQILLRNKSMLCSCITDAIRLKAQIVGQDERDAGARLLLNFGHTVGHALEALSHLRLSHGQAVSIGMACEMALVKTKDADRIVELLRMIEMPTEMPKNCSSKDLLKIMQHDKKTLDRELRFAVPTAIGIGTVMSFNRALIQSCQ